MKVMDIEMESEDCAIVVSAPPKKKKLKQGRLPFQTLASSASPNMLLTKKRKHMSPSPTGFRSPKIVKITTKENSAESKVFAAESDRKRATDDKEEEAKNSTEDAANSASAHSETSSDKLTDNNEAAAKDKKISAKSQTKLGAITRFLHKVPQSDARKEQSDARKDQPDARKDQLDGRKDQPDIRKNQPVVLLTRCDNIDNESESSERGSSMRQKSDAAEKPSVSKSDESSNDELAKELEDSDDEKSNDETSKEKSDASSDNPVGNSDSDSERGISSSDEETDEQKTDRNNDSESGEKTLNDKGLEKTPTSGVKSDGANAARRKLTPKQLEKKMESTKRREEREKLKQEKEKKLEEDRLLRQKEKEAQRQAKKEKEVAEKELKRKEKEHKEWKKQMENEQKQKEKLRRDKAKEEDRRKREEAKEEEKRKKEDERLEAERKKQKAASTFVSFFVPKKLESKAAAEEEKLIHTSNFMPFEVKADMRVAPICRRSLNDSDKSKFDQVCLDKLKGVENLYITEIKEDGRKIRKSGKTWPPESKDDDIVLIEEDDVGNCNMVDQSNAAVDKQRAKLLAFAENRRPPYWGTWRKRSAAVTPRRPFSKDTKWFDYEVDSDEEWEEEEPGESIRGSDDEKDEENVDDDEYDVDNEFMVPHGYLSDEEAQADEDEEDMSPETQKFKLKILGEEFEAERKTQTSKIKPKVIGCIWQGPVNSYPENIPQKLVDFLMARQAWVRETPIMLATRAEANSAIASENPGASGAGEDKRGSKKTRVPDEALPELIRLIHGNPHGRGFLIKEFMTFWNRKNLDNDRPLSKSSLSKKICEFARRMACPEEGPMHLKTCWYVSEETRKAYLGDEQLTLPNRWTYALTPKRKTLTEAPEVMEKSEKEEKDKEKEKKIEPLITQYTKKITQEEMKKQLTVKPSQTSTPRASTSFQSKPHKRATLISVGRGEQFPKSSIISAFSKIPSALTSKPADSPNSSTLTIEKNLTVTPMVVDLDSESSVEFIDVYKTENSMTK